MHPPGSKKSSRKKGIFLLVGVILILMLLAGLWVDRLLRPPLAYLTLGLVAGYLVAFLVLDFIKRRGITGWGAPGSFKGWLGYLGGIMVIAGLLGILGTGGWNSVLGEREESTMTEGETRPLPFQAGDSLHLYKYKPSFHPGSRSVKGYHALVVTFIDSAYSLDTVSLHQPLNKEGRRIYLTDHGASHDSTYLLFRLRLPWGDTISYEFPPHGVIDDPRFPFLVAFEDFYLDRSQLWPNPEVPVVTIKVMRPGRLVLSRRLRAPDSVAVEDCRLFFDGIRWRPTVDFVHTTNLCRLSGLICAGLLLLGLILAFISRAAGNLGEKDD